MKGISRRGIIVAALLTLLASCGAARHPLRLRVHVAPRANQDRPVAVDLVAASDKRLGDKLGGMTAADWFAQREQFRRDYLAPRSLEVHSWEWVPGQVVDELEIPLGLRARSIYLFARYAGAGPHRTRLENQGVTQLTLGETDMTVEPGAHGRSLKWPKR